MNACGGHENLRETLGSLGIKTAPGDPRADAAALRAYQSRMGTLNTFEEHFGRDPDSYVRLLCLK